MDPSQENPVQRAQKFVSGIENSDPLKLGKHTQQNRGQKRNIYMLLVVIPVLLIVSFVSYTIATLDGAVFGTPQGEVDDIVEAKMKEIVDQVEKTTGTSSSSVGNSFEKIVFGLKLIPNMADHKDLMKTMSMVGGSETGYTGLEGDVDYDTLALGDQSDYPKFFEWNGAHQLNFPEMAFDANHVPMGNSVRMCLGV